MLTSNVCFENVNDLTGTIIGAAIRVHSTLGPGLLEHAYKRCLAYELELGGVGVRTELELSLKYRDLVIPGAYRLDLMVENTIIVEIKAVEKLLPVHHSQVLTYLKLTGKPLGLLMNFNVPRLPDGLKRLVNNLTPDFRLPRGSATSARGSS
jgi:GxxExxY protein